MSVAAALVALSKFISLRVRRVLPSVLWRCWLVGKKSIQLVKKTERWGAGVVICLERGADLHMAQWIPLPLTVSYFSKIQIGFTFLVPAHPGSPRQRAIKCTRARVRACVCVCEGVCVWVWVSEWVRRTNVGIVYLPNDYVIWRHCILLVSDSDSFGQFQLLICCCCLVNRKRLNLDC